LSLEINFFIKKFEKKVFFIRIFEVKPTLMGIVLGWVRVSIFPLRNTLFALRGIHFSIFGRVTKKRAGAWTCPQRLSGQLFRVNAPGSLKKKSNEPVLRCSHGSHKNLNKKKNQIITLKNSFFKQPPL
jgi:hypothetical protein